MCHLCEAAGITPEKIKETTAFSQEQYRIFMEVVDKRAPEMLKAGFTAADTFSTIIKANLEAVKDLMGKESGINMDNLTKTILLGMVTTYLEAKHWFKK